MSPSVNARPRQNWPERLHAGLRVALCLLAACEAPPVFATADARQNQQLSRIEGNVIVSSTARGNVIVFLFDAAKPPPPLGTGKPLTFAVINKDLVFKGAAPNDLGPFTAPFALSLIAPGQYLIRGFVDANADFVPWYGITGEPNLGDVGGGAVDVVTHVSKTIDLISDGGVPVPVLDVPVSFSDTAKVPVDRPVFEVNGGSTSVMLGSTATVISLLSRPISSPAVSEAHPVFLAHLVDANGDGMPDLGADGRPLFWPRVIVRKISSPLVDETTVDYEHAAAPADGKPDVVVLAAGFDFSALMPQLVDADGHVNLAPTPVPVLSLVIQPLAVDASNPFVLAPLKTVPPGRYAITVIQETGQTWRVPNELTPGIAEPLGFTAVPSQGLVLEKP